MVHQANWPNHRPRRTLESLVLARNAVKPFKGSQTPDGWPVKVVVRLFYLVNLAVGDWCSVTYRCAKRNALNIHRLPTNSLRVAENREHAVATSEPQPDLDNLVPHPRYSTLPDWARPETPKLKWTGYAYRPRWIFPESGLQADLTRQTPATVQRDIYYDVVTRCVDCARYFVFYAREQKYWYEELNFPLCADCIRCCECRHAARDIRERFQRFELLRNQDTMTDDEVATLAEDTAILWNHGIVTRENKARQILNQAAKRIPDHSCIEMLRAALTAKT